MKTVLLGLLVFVASAVCAWTVAVSLCNHLLLATRPFDFVCGHNAPLQLVPSFLLFLVVYSRLAWWIKGRGSSAGSKSPQNQK